MTYIAVTKQNIDKEHICCAISNNKDSRVASKKQWLIENFDNDLKFIKLDDRGKVFIEYMPSEKAWAPIEANNFIHINCFWVSGKFVKQGHGSALLNLCIEDAKKQNKEGLVILSSKKKMPFLSDPTFLKKKGFMVADTVGYFELLYLPLVVNAKIPQFTNQAKNLEITAPGIVVYYSHQCPHTQMYVDIIEKIANDKGVPFSKVKFETFSQAQAAPAPFTTYSFFDEGVFVTNEIFGPKKFEKYLENRE